jgi:cyclophilin family peptidyl-prolyl cis-trans isomerase
MARLPSHVLRSAFVLLVVAASLGAAGCGGKSASSSGGCENLDAPSPRTEHATAPSGTLDPAKTYSLRFETSCGTFVVRLDPKLAPHATASLVKLARSGYFDDTVFHRIIPGFVVQGGDPSQTGAGGPGYSTVDPPPATARYTKGVVAMAKTQAEAPGTAGSQFFVVTAADAGLPPDYAVVGKVGSGLAVVDRIGKLGDQSGTPTRTVVVHKAAVIVS